MDFETFRRVVTAFADTKTDFESSRGNLIAQVRGELVQAQVRTVEGEIVVDDDLVTGMSARQWIVTRIARLPQLADRILDTIPIVRPFVHPSGKVDDEGTGETDESVVADAIAEATRLLELRPGGTTSLLYLTSDAGEGKTTVINHLARERAAAYKRKEADWLLVPVTLGGRTFMRFDDIVIAEMVNRFRFPFFYYEGFLELTRLGAVVPAFDGFEEMFVEGSSGEALSALGGLIRSLESSGTVLIAARKAYFDFRSAAIRAHLFDSISANAVSTARVSLVRWNRAQFLEYAAARGYESSEELYEAVALRLGTEHAILTRAVLVARLIDVARSHVSLTPLLEALGRSPADYFHEFVDTILAREANEKWIDRQGEAARALLTIGQHEELLGLVAQEMWIANSDVLRHATLDLVAEIFSEGAGLDAMRAHQVKERLAQHSLLSTADAGGRQYVFDHEDFRRYFLGESIGRVLVTPGMPGIRPLLRAGTLPGDTCDAIVRYVRRSAADAPDLVAKLSELGRADVASGYARENVGALIIRLLDANEMPVRVEGTQFPADALRARWLAGHTFVGCEWAVTSVEDAHLLDVTFEGCRFAGLEVGGAAQTENVVLQDDCDVQVVTRRGGGARTFDPDVQRGILQSAGFTYGSIVRPSIPLELKERDAGIVLTERMLRVFLRHTQANEDLLRRKLGRQANQFFGEVLPALEHVGVVEELLYLGRGHQRRFKLGRGMTVIDEGLLESNGSFERFCAMMKEVG